MHPKTVFFVDSFFFNSYAPFYFLKQALYYVFEQLYAAQTDGTIKT